MNFSKITLLIAGLFALLLASIVAFINADVPHIPMRSELRFHPFTKIDQPYFGYVDGATISVEVGCAPTFDKLFFNYQGNFQIDNTYDGQRCVLYLVGFAPVAEYIDAITSVVFYTSKEDFQDRRLTWTLGRGTFYNSLTNHFYKFQPLISSWQDAQTQCSQTTLLGMQGYLATITSNEEMVGIGSKTNMSLWTGLMATQNAAGAAVWTWATGPEAGWPQWIGDSMYEGGVPQNTREGPAFSNWGRFQPSNVPFLNADEARYVAILPSSYENVAYWQNMHNTDGVQGYVCEYDEVMNPTLASQMSQWAGSVILEFSCANYSASATECTNRAAFGCVFSAGVCQQSLCSVHSSSKGCVADARCQWNADLLIGRCVNRHCTAYSSVATCQADPSCFADLSTGIAVCRDAVCTDAQNSCTCSSIEGCSWRNSKCGYADSIGCDGMDVVFVFDASSSMDQQFQQYPGGFQGLTDTLLSSQYYLTGTRAGVNPTGSFGMRVGFVRFSSAAQTQTVGFGSSGQLTGDYREVMSDLTYLQQNFAPTGTRSLVPALTRAKKMFTDDAANFAPAALNRQQTIVVITAGAISDVPFSYTSIVGSAIKVVAVSLRPSFPPSIGSIATDASLMTIFQNKDLFVSTVMSELQPLGIYAICDINTTLGAAVASTGSRDLCRNYLDKFSCRAKSVCAWSYSANSCVSSQCLSHCDINSCTADATCTYVSGSSTCEESCPAQSASTCNQKPLCQLNVATQKCEPLACVSNPTEDACIADTVLGGCYYNASSPVKCKPVECNFDSSAKCQTFSATCTWNAQEGVCFRDACKIAGTNTGLCAQNSQCKVDGTGMCVLRSCAMHSTETACNFVFECNWDITMSPPACMPAPCYKFNQNAQTAMTNCQAQPTTCFWQAATGGNPSNCVPMQCGFQNRSCDCAKLPQCVWRNDQCKDSTYVQCPAIDLMFVIEGTPVMSKPFGRHPNGFMGIVESIRSWSRNAPMTTDPAGTGFRFAVSAYGPSKTAWIIGTGVGAGNDFTGNSNFWLGDGKMLSEIEKIQQSQNEFAGTDVGIFPALQNARKVFEGRTDNAGRTKILVVIGNSPITDGGASVRNEIAAIEADGIQIFSNVLRRFSSVTPIDVMAADYIMPISSDAMSAHFLFTTIDSLRSTLLDKFCDPSSNTGKALQVSRDRTLPCNWLQKSECNMQPTCMWDVNAAVTCPLAGQCPNLGCTALPDALAKKFICANCQLKNGAFSCVTGGNYATPNGLCVQSTCMSKCQTSCALDTTCVWNVSTSRCDRNWCKSYGDALSCNADTGCVWDDIDLSPAGCRQGLCWQYRGLTTCNAQIASTAPARSLCIWQEGYSPAICEERRCDALTQSDCNLFPGVCSYDLGAGGRKCSHVECGYTNGEDCEIDSTCFWNPYDQVCKKRTINCIISKFSAWTPCTASCGNGITYKARRIIQFPSNSRLAVTCPIALNNMNDGEHKMVVTENCNNVSQYKANWMNSCTDYCTQFNSNVSRCVRDMNCNWVSVSGTASCQPKLSIGCESMSQSDCISSDMCDWSSDLSFCLPAVKQCRFTDADSCKNIPTCAWRTGQNTFSLASGIGMGDVSLFNPGQEASFVFPSLSFPSTDAAATNIIGASVMIETNYQAGKDKLDLSLPTQGITIQWMPTSGTLVLTGIASVSDYAHALSLVTFQSTSTQTKARTITYSLGLRVGNAGTTGGATPGTVVYSGASTNAYIQYSNNAGVTYSQAAYACQASSLHGRRGYLATILTPEENDVVSTKLEASGWIGADDASGRWKWSQGPTPDQGTFWVGGSSLGGGLAVSGQFNNWFINDGEPTNDNFQRQRALVIGQNSYWYAKKNTDLFSTYVCKYGGLTTDTPLDYPMGGSRILGVGGCVPPTCVWHVNRGNCTADPECEWNGATGICRTGCLSRSTASECASSTSCFWDMSTLPATCQRNPCDGMGFLLCSQLTKCYWDKSSGICALKTGCAAIDTKADCDRSKTCEYFAGMGGCVTKPCTSLTDGASCSSNPLCQWTGGLCLTSICKATDKPSCDNDKGCTWSNPIQAGFIPGGEAIHPFANSYFPPNSSDFIDGVTIRITQGYHQGMDTLSMDQTPQMRAKFTAMWLPTYGSLLLTAAYASNPVSAIEAYNMVKNAVSFQTASSRPNARQFVVTWGLSSILTVYNNPVGSETKLMKQVDPNIVYATRAAAQARCMNSKYFGASGILAEPNNDDANTGLRDVQARGWIGAVVTNGVWSWQRALTSFWKLANGLGSPINLPVPTPASNYEFAQWTPGQPTNTATGAMIINEGFWTSVTEPNTVLRGIVCEYKSTDMTIQNFNGIVVAEPKGCYPKPCAGLPEALCKRDSSCIWGQDANNQATCYLDNWCSRNNVPTTCAALAGCYWDQGLAACNTAPASACTNLVPEQCSTVTGCTWNNLLKPNNNSMGACVATGCSIHPTKSSCFQDPLCRWYTADSSPQGLCVERLCGYTTQTACWMDQKCIWDPNQVKCVASECIGSSQNTCNNLPACAWNAAGNVCLWQRCSSRIDINTAAGFAKCLWDPTCLAVAGQGCSQPKCDYATQNQCNADKSCFYFSSSVAGGGTQGYCGAAQCTSQGSQTSCGGTLTSDPCRWNPVTGACRQASPEDMSPKTDCVREIQPNLTVVYVFIVIILLLLIAILYRVYLAYAKGLNFFDPARKNVKFNAHSSYAAELYNFAQQGGVEENQAAEAHANANQAANDDYNEYAEEEHPDL